MRQFFEISSDFERESLAVLALLHRGHKSDRR